MARIARDMQLVDDGVLEWPLQRLVSAPVVIVGRCDLGPKRRARIAVDRGLAIPLSVADEARPRVEQLAPRVEPQTGRRLVRPVRAPGVEPARARVRDEHVPEAERPVSRGRKLELGDRLGIGRAAVEVQPNSRRAQTEDGEIDATVLHRRAKSEARALALPELRGVVAPQAQSLRIKPSSYGCDKCGWSGTARTSYSSVPA